MLRHIYRNQPIPYFIGKSLSYIPFDYRPFLRGSYLAAKNDIAEWKEYDNAAKQNYIYSKFKRILMHAYENVYMYKDYYDKLGFDPRSVESFIDIEQVPLVDKKLLLGYSLEERTYSVKGMLKVNTGGSTGSTLAFNIVPEQIGHEWGHMHDSWKSVGYSYKDLKLTFSGRSNVKKKFYYDALRNHFLIDVYKKHSDYNEEISSLFVKYRIPFLHGYPSAIYDFCVYLEDNVSVLMKVKPFIRAVIFSSEFPNEIYRNKIEDVLECKSYAFYGHTERTLLATEISKGIYAPHQTYGYAEAIKRDSGGMCLVGTCYSNTSSPFVRYDTSDVISNIAVECGVLESFVINEGRVAEFVLDKIGRRVGLTGLIFGRHHSIFDHCSHLQVSDLGNGHVAILYSGSKDLGDKAKYYFDSANVNIEFQFIYMPLPIYSTTGKVVLLVNKEVLKDKGIAF